MSCMEVSRSYQHLACEFRRSATLRGGHACLPGLRVAHCNSVLGHL